MGNFTFADIYGPNYGFATTRMQSIPEQGDQEALVDDTVASADVHTEPAAKRNMIIFLIVAIVFIIIFSLSS